jgi:hypothetical protein
LRNAFSSMAEILSTSLKGNVWISLAMWHSKSKWHVLADMSILLFKEFLKNLCTVLFLEMHSEFFKQNQNFEILNYRSWWEILREIPVQSLAVPGIGMPSFAADADIDDRKLPWK